ncbi:hypothetical protein NLM33_35950 [Bradyrhizobium sp. CCGUVB1N3]|uniref:hypothetical protein n=1 Tax=Bradyrhizobium sp. CCGUVB1N3 TaxID=2949629 RepID=UPI0020B363E0|nr:hypothetical protein [Bradyrhizobium sp. CCGUVB1N3]MCP3475670.1 hypothetical protein [Bradyrhizobium sp. CCGUVB1N3]
MAGDFGLGVRHAWQGSAADFIIADEEASSDYGHFDSLQSKLTGFVSEVSAVPFRQLMRLLRGTATVRARTTVDRVLLLTAVLFDLERGTPSGVCEALQA